MNEQVANVALVGAAVVAAVLMVAMLVGAILWRSSSKSRRPIGFAVLAVVGLVLVFALLGLLMASPAMGRDGLQWFRLLGSLVQLWLILLGGYGLLCGAVWLVRSVRSRQTG